MWLLIASVSAPPSRATRCAAIVSAVSPDCETAIASVFVVEHREAVAELRGVLDVDGHPRPLLDQQAADHAGVAGGAAGA